jgi:hypothetical protein
MIFGYLLGFRTTLHEVVTVTDVQTGVVIGLFLQ